MRLLRSPPARGFLAGTIAHRSHPVNAGSARPGSPRPRPRRGSTILRSGPCPYRLREGDGLRESSRSSLPPACWVTPENLHGETTPGRRSGSRHGEQALRLRDPRSRGCRLERHAFPGRTRIVRSLTQSDPVARSLQREGRPGPVSPHHQSDQRFSVRGRDTTESACAGSHPRGSGQEPGLEDAPGRADWSAPRGHGRRCVGEAGNSALGPYLRGYPGPEMGDDVRSTKTAVLTPPRRGGSGGRPRAPARARGRWWRGGWCGPAAGARRDRW